MTTTVTMSIDEYKELEGKAIAFDKMINEKDVIIVRVPYGSYYYYHITQKEVFERINKEIHEVSVLAESWRQKAERK